MISAVPPCFRGKVGISALKKAEGNPFAISFPEAGPGAYKTSPGRPSQVPSKSLRDERVHSSVLALIADSSRDSLGARLMRLFRSVLSACLRTTILAPT